jgi:hypothetical protein
VEIAESEKGTEEESKTEASSHLKVWWDLDREAGE